MTVKTERLAAAIKTVTDHYDWAIDEKPDVIVALLSTREDLDFAEVNSWTESTATESEVEAYILVLESSREDVSAALRTLL